MFNKTAQHNKGSGIKGGFTLLYAVLVAGLMLAIGLAIFNISIKEITLSSSGRESQFAFFAADSGVECALFHDFRNDAFKAGPDGIPDGSTTSIECGGEVMEVHAVQVDADTYHRTFEMRTGLAPYCANVLVVKTLGATYETTVTARGYNTCNTNNPRRVERAIHARY